jgi:hypothetical protein
MSLWIKQDGGDYDYINYFSLKKLQHEAKQLRLNKGINDPIFHDLTKCYHCKKDLGDDIFDFYSDADNEYCKHQYCRNYVFEKNNLQLVDLEEGINNGNIDYSHDTIIPSHIKILYVNSSNKELDLSQTQLETLHASSYYDLNLDAFNTIKQLNICNTVADFTKFTNLIKLNLSYAEKDIDLSCCKNLSNAEFKNIKTNINLSGCCNLKNLILTNIQHLNECMLHNSQSESGTGTSEACSISCKCSAGTVILKGCTQLSSLVMNKVSAEIDFTDCTNLNHIRLEEMNIISASIPSLQKLNILDCEKEINMTDFSQFPNLTSLTITNSRSNMNILYCVNINLDKLKLLESFLFTDIRIMSNPIVYNFNFSNNNRLAKIDIYSAKHHCNVTFGDNLVLTECNLDFISRNIINIPKNVTKKYLKRVIIN